MQTRAPNFKLSAEHRDLLDEPITSEETLQAIRTLKLHKSPGTDGLPFIFYKKCASQLSIPLTDIFNMVGTDGIMPPSWSQSHIVVLPEQGKDLLNPASFRPISLLNQDFKLMSSSLSISFKQNHLFIHFTGPIWFYSKP